MIRLSNISIDKKALCLRSAIHLICYCPFVDELFCLLAMFMLNGWDLVTQKISSFYTFSVGQRSRDCLDPTMILMSLISLLAVCFGSMSCRKNHPWPIFSDLVKEFLSAVNLSCNLSRKTAPNHNLSISVLNCGEDVLWIILILISFSPNKMKLIPKSFILVSTALSPKPSFTCSLTNWTRACACVFHKQEGSYRCCNIWINYNVLPMIFLVIAFQQAHPM